jgi:phosphonopyruvate decarboxylase
VVLATTGKTGRELFELRVARQEESASDFLNVGAMGHAIAVALGMAIARPDRAIVLLDGDGAAAMHLGSQLTVANSAPPNLMHILFNNRAHESVGGQSTELSASDLSHVALAAGYRSAGTVDTLAGLSDTVSAGITDDGPVFIEALIQAGSRSDLGRPTVSRKDSRDEIRRKFDQ